MPAEFFISYNHNDQAWGEWVAAQLESAGHSTVIQAWDFRPGDNFALEMQRAAQDCDRTIAILSPDYLASSYTQPEWATAFAQDPTGAKKKLLPIRVRECKPTGLLGQIIYIDLVGLNEAAARNTLLNGIQSGRAKPSQTAFPGASSDGTSAKYPRPPAFPPTSSGGNSRVATTAATRVAAVPQAQVSIHCPHELMGLESLPIELRFAVPLPTHIEVAIEGDDFLVSDESGIPGTAFPFDFPDQGVFEKHLDLRAREPKDANRILSLTFTDATGRVITRNRYPVRVTEPLIWWKFGQSLRALVQWAVGNWKRAVATVLVVLMASIGWFSIQSLERKRALLLWFDLGHPKDYLALNDKWGDDFSEEAQTAAKWTLDPGYRIHWAHVAEHHGPAPETKFLELEGPASAYAAEDAKPIAFYDFRMTFSATLVASHGIEWVVRAWPAHAEGKDPRKAYRFALNATHPDPPHTRYYVDAQYCTGAGLTNCRPLAAASKTVAWLDSCGHPHQLILTMTARGGKFAVSGNATVAHSQSCTSYLPPMEFEDTSASASQYGMVGFHTGPGQKVALSLVNIFNPDKSAQ